MRRDSVIEYRGDQDRFALHPLCINSSPFDQKTNQTIRSVYLKGTVKRNNVLLLERRKLSRIRGFRLAFLNDA